MPNNFNPLVSIVIPVYNGSNYMKSAIDSALLQTYENIEVIVVNDGSTDNTEEIALSYGNKIRYFKKENGGVATALNLAIKNAEGDYISWLSHDDVYLENKLERQIQELCKLEDKNTILYSNWLTINENSEQIDEVKLHQLHKIQKLHFPLYPLLNGIIHGCSLLIPKICFDEVGLFNTELRTTQDYDLWYKMFPKYKIEFIQEPLIKSRWHKDQDSKKRPETQLEADALWIKMIKDLSENDILTMEESILVFYKKVERITKDANYIGVNKFIKNEIKKIEGNKRIMQKFKNLLYTNKLDGNKTRIKLFRFIPLLKIKKFDKIKKYYLFGFLPIFDKEIRKINKSLDKIELFLTLSTVCNYNCVFCNREVKPEIVRIENILKFDELIQHANMIDITGYGEITIHPDFVDIIKKISNKKVPIRFVTNGSKLNKEYAELLVKSEMQEIVFSLNSLNPETYKKIHGKSANLETVLENIDYLLSLKPTFNVRLSFVMTAWNLHEIPDFIKYAKDRIGKIASVTCMGLTPTLSHMYSQELIIENTKENKEYLKKMQQLGEESGLPVSILDLDNQTTNDASIDPERLKHIIKKCDWVYNKSFILQDGDVGACCWSDVRLGNIKESSFKEIWNGRPYKDLRNNILKGDTTHCSNCRREN